jgi:hypothetical protein
MTEKPTKIIRGLWNNARQCWEDHPELNSDCRDSCYGEPESTCPFCGFVCVAEYCDIGVGKQQVSPFRCDCCHAIERGAFDKDEGEVTRHGWYLPESPPDRESNNHVTTD